MYTPIDYEIQDITTNESKNFNRSISNIRNQNIQYWQAIDPKEEERIVIRFDPAIINKCTIKIRACESVIMRLYNKNEHGDIANEKYLERNNFMSNDMEKSYITTEQDDKTFEFAEIVLKPRNGELSVYHVLLFGKTQKNTQEIHQNKMSQIIRPSQINLFAQRIRSPEGKLVISQNQSQQSQNQGQQMIQRSQQQNAQSLFYSQQQKLIIPRDSNKQYGSEQPVKLQRQPSPLQSSVFKDDLDQALKLSLETFLEESKLQQLNQDDLDALEKIELIEQQSSSKGQTGQTGYTTETKPINQSNARFSIAQSLQFKQNQLKYIEIQPPDIQELDFEDMFQVTSQMIRKEFVDSHCIFEESNQQEGKLFNYLNENYKPLHGLVIHIYKDDITDFELEELVYKIKNLGGVYSDKITADTSIIISDRLVYKFDKKFNIVTLNTKFLKECRGLQLVNYDKYIVKGI